MRGERTVAVMIRSAPYGSSPHTRGTRPPAARCGRASRFIPACAGNARRSPGPSGATSVHPRIRGERSGSIGAPPPPGGSSPHTRGTRADDRRCHPGSRFIPAYAGNATLFSRSSLSVRFIPAYAGNARPHARATGCFSVHPRIRGERWMQTSAAHRWVGSSPHTRGTRRPAARAVAAWRFIPAYAGNAEKWLEGAVMGAVHPRIRGER
mgnify:CR=1 FL=1